MTYILAVSKSGKSVLTATDPNDFIFHSAYNTLKIIATGTVSDTIAGSGAATEFTVAHGLGYTPLVSAFAKINNEIYVAKPNEAARLTSNVSFWSAGADATNLIFRFFSSWTAYAVVIRYYVFEPGL